MITAVKHDAGKPEMSLIPRESMEGVAAVLSFGKRKYAAHNWRGGFAWSRLLDAALRHITSFNNGEDLDPESGLSHIDHAACCLAFLQAHIKSGLGKDDRYRKPVVKDADVGPLPQAPIAAYRPPSDIRPGDKVTVKPEEVLSKYGERWNLTAGLPYTVSKVGFDSVTLEEFPAISAFSRSRFVRVA